eukprot:TRINITY_DN10891_c0_g1_i1.p3 TRINITY_DN10891_c0_g1~~TRINITY_DN10891_c0_g1_i1.p3  ORF type:complete len:282 (+),score=29.59 TRINITY_DN10891_c0_g1_i1:2944-3789(+)
MVCKAFSRPVDTLWQAASLALEGGSLVALVVALAAEDEGAAQAAGVLAEVALTLAVVKMVLDAVLLLHGLWAARAESRAEKRQACAAPTPRDVLQLDTADGSLDAPQVQASPLAASGSMYAMPPLLGQSLGQPGSPAGVLQSTQWAQCETPRHRRDSPVAPSVRWTPAVRVSATASAAPGRLRALPSAGRQHRSATAAGVQLPGSGASQLGVSQASRSPTAARVGHAPATDSGHTLATPRHRRRRLREETRQVQSQALDDDLQVLMSRVVSPRRDTGKGPR